MSDDEPNIEDIADIEPEKSVEETVEQLMQAEQIENISNLSLSGRLELYKNSSIGLQQRSRGILSKTDREYLLGLKDYENRQSEANRRQDIRNRIKNSLQDFKIIWAMLEENDRNQVFASLDDETVDDSIEAIMSFIYLGLDQDVPRIEKAIKRGILAGENVSSEGDAKQIDVSINIDYYPDVEATKEKLQDSPLVEFTVEEIGVLAKAGELDPSHVEKMNDAYIHPPPGYFGYPSDEPRAKDAQGNEIKGPNENVDSNSENS